jgi:hypothetical protein
VVARGLLTIGALLGGVLLSVRLNANRGQLVVPLASWVPGGDFTGHLVLALLISLAVNVGLVGTTAFGHRLGPRAATYMVIAFFTLEEMHQQFAPGRQVQAQDLAASVLGAALGGALISAWQRARDGRRAAASGDSDSEPV